MTARGGVRRSFSAALVAGLACAAACTPIEPVPGSSAPLNRCPEHPCDGYAQGGRASPRCRAGRCEIPAPGAGRPDYPFWIVVHVPDTAIFAAGSTFVLYSDTAGEPAFTPPESNNCRSIQRGDTVLPCVQVGDLAAVTGEYTVTREASVAVGYPLADRTPIPVRVVYEPRGNAQRPTFEPTLPLDFLFDASTLVRRGQAMVPQHVRALPFGTYLRVLYPQPPFDEYFPPTADVQTIESPNHVDRFVLGLPPPSGKLLDETLDDKRLAIVTREEGLDGWRVWVQDATSHRRISVIRTLSGTEASVQLYTTGESDVEGVGGALRDDVEAVVAPPDDWSAVPRFVTPLFGGDGLKRLFYPAIPPPVPVTGVVAFSAPDGTLLGIPSKVTFRSDRIVTRTEPTQLLQYETSLSTDDRGRFATILPPGTYFATIEPDSATGYAKVRQPVVIDRTVTALTLEPPPRPIVKGRVVLTDGRPVGEAEIVAVPETPQSSQVPKPRPGRTRTRPDGGYTLELDPGPYLFTVIPKAGTGFPRVVTRPEVPAVDTELPDIRVPAPTRLAFVLRDPSPTGNPIVRAVVRVFAAIPGREDRPVEIGSAITEPDGSVEILLAQEPR